MSSFTSTITQTFSATADKTCNALCSSYQWVANSYIGQKVSVVTKQISEFAKPHLSNAATASAPYIAAAKAGLSTGTGAGFGLIGCALLVHLYTKTQKFNPTEDVISQGNGQKYHANVELSKARFILKITLEAAALTALVAAGVLLAQGSAPVGLLGSAFLPQFGSNLLTSLV